MILKILVALLLLSDVHAKGKSSDRIKREECEKLEVCKWDDTENCVLRCMSIKCYEKIYADLRLEPGEIHREKYQLFLECFRSEEKLLKQSKYSRD
jgi:hypothetical protein